MSRPAFAPTHEQKAVIGHSRSAFISACPGAGKTQVLVERARQELKNLSSGQGLAFLSFTNAAISELKSRLMSEGILPNPPFPHYVGTFDTFIWQFFVAPLGIPGQSSTPKLIPDLEERTVTAYENGQELALSCFDPVSGNILSEKAKQAGFDADAKPPLTKRYEESARSCRERFVARGELGFNDVRAVVKTHLGNSVLSARLSAALAARFREIVVDEAQDCNPDDLEIINWLRNAGIVTKIICDPHQSIYEFRGGVTDQLFTVRDSFEPSDRLRMSGNFRSNENICKAIAAFRAPGEQQATDKPMGVTSTDTTPVYFLLYKGTTIPPSIGQHFKALLQQHRLKPTDSPVISSTKDGAYKAVGQPIDSAAQHRTLRLALAVSRFHAGLEVGVRKQTMESLHRIMLELSGGLEQRTYYQHVITEGIRPEEWRPQALEILQALRYSSTAFSNSDFWLNSARTLLSPYLKGDTGSIAQKLSKHPDLSNVLTSIPLPELKAGTIHSVKGMQFPGVCVVMSTTTAKGIVDYLTTGQPKDNAEGARKIYVGASRAERLLVIAMPKSQGTRLIAHVQKNEASVSQIVVA